MLLLSLVCKLSTSLVNSSSILPPVPLKCSRMNCLQSRSGSSWMWPSLTLLSPLVSVALSLLSLALTTASFKLLSSKRRYWWDTRLLKGAWSSSLSSEQMSLLSFSFKCELVSFPVPTKTTTWLLTISWMLWMCPRTRRRSSTKWLAHGMRSSSPFLPPPIFTSSLTLLWLPDSGMSNFLPVRMRMGSTLTQCF